MAEHEIAPKCFHADGVNEQGECVTCGCLVPLRTWSVAGPELRTPADGKLYAATVEWMHGKHYMDADKHIADALITWARAKALEE